jgi:hypothetical protein
MTIKVLIKLVTRELINSIFRYQSHEKTSHDWDRGATVRRLCSFCVRVPYVVYLPCSFLLGDCEISKTSSTSFRHHQMVIIDSKVYLERCKPGHGQPGPTSLAQKSRAWTTFFGLMGRPRPQIHGSTAYLGWPRLKFWMILGRPSLMTRQLDKN